MIYITSALIAVGRLIMGFGNRAPHKKDPSLTRAIYIVYSRPAKGAAAGLYLGGEGGA